MAAMEKPHGWSLIEGGKGRSGQRSTEVQTFEQLGIHGVLAGSKPLKFRGEMAKATGMLAGGSAVNQRVNLGGGSLEAVLRAHQSGHVIGMQDMLDSLGGEPVGALKNHMNVPKSEAPPKAETAHNPPMTDVTRAELDAKFELLDTKLGARIQQAVDAMQARDEVHKHALEKMQTEFASRDALYAEMAKRQDVSTEKLKSEMVGRDAVYAEIAKRQELAAEKFREEMAGRDAVAAERARAHELTVQKALAEAAGREALMDQRLKSMDGELAKIGDSFKSVKANIWFGVATTASIVAAIVAVALAGFDSGRETSKAIAESTVKLEQLIKAQEAKAAAPAAPATPSAATPAPVAAPESPAAK